MKSADIKKMVRKTLSRPRAAHCEAVAGLARELARRHGWNPDLAYKTGLLHDIAKEWSPARLRRYATEKRLRIPHVKDIFKLSPNVLHGYVGAHMVKENKWIKDRAAIRAIRMHTLGDSRMGLAEKIIYVADLASPDRTYKSAKKVRQLAKENIEAAFKMAVGIKIRAQVIKEKHVHLHTIRVWNHVVRRK